jgi:uncharacterized protein (DUF169 family)
MPTRPVDLSVFKTFDFERPPVGVKYTFLKPEGIKRTQKRLKICEMLSEAWDNEPFYAEKDDILCVGRVVLGMGKDPILEAGLFGPRFELFDEPRVNEALYRLAPTLTEGTCRYVSFAALDEMTFDPDVLLITCNSPQQAAIFERAVTRATLNVLSSKTAPALACAWVYAGPFLTGETNYVVTPVGFGTGIMPDGLIIITFPYQILPGLVRTLEDNDWTPKWVGFTRQELLDESDRHMKELEELSGVSSDSDFLC